MLSFDTNCGGIQAAICPICRAVVLGLVDDDGRSHIDIHQQWHADNSTTPPEVTT